MDDIDRKKSSIVRLFKEGSEPATQGKIKVKGSRNITIGGSVAGDVNVDVKKVSRPSITPTSEHISDATARKIQIRIETLVDIEAETDEQRRRAYAKWYKAIKNRYLVSSYKLIPRHLSEEVISWLVQLAAIAGREKGKASRNSSPLRVNLFKQIWTVSGQLGLPKGGFTTLFCVGLVSGLHR